MKLNEFLAASLPYGLEYTYPSCIEWGGGGVLTGKIVDERIDDVIPVVRSLSDLTKPITQANYNEGKLFVPLYRLLENSGFNVSKMTEAEILEYAEVYSNIDLIQLSDLHLYLIWHFDLLDEGIEKVLVTDEFNPY